MDSVWPEALPTGVEADAQRNVRPTGCPADVSATVSPMSLLFAEAFAEALQEPASESPEHRYDETLALSVLPDGRFFIDHARLGETQTATKAAGEQDDRDEDTTITEANAEGDTWRAATLDGTHTAVKGEADDWASTRKGAETATFVQAEGDDWAGSPQLDTGTRVRGEVDDWAD